MYAVQLNTITVYTVNHHYVCCADVNHKCTLYYVQLNISTGNTICVKLYSLQCTVYSIHHFCVNCIQCSSTSSQCTLYAVQLYMSTVQSGSCGLQWHRCTAPPVEPQPPGREEGAVRCSAVQWWQWHWPVRVASSVRCGSDGGSE